jgi:RNA polymerase sigma-70 factor (ECF subfamily)
MTAPHPPPATRRTKPTGPDSELVRRARGGDVLAFGELVERHRALVYRVAARMVGPDDADDVAQEAFLRAYHRLGKFRGDAPFRAWLLRITHNAALDTLDRRQRDPIASESASGEQVSDAVVPVDHKTPADELEIAERRARLESKLDGLRPSHRSVLVLRDLEGLAYDEIAALTETPLGSVKGRLHRARTELIEILRSNTYDWELPDER